MLSGFPVLHVLDHKNITSFIINKMKKKREKRKDNPEYFKLIFVELFIEDLKSK